MLAEAAPCLQFGHLQDGPVLVELTISSAHADIKPIRSNWLAEDLALYDYICNGPLLTSCEITPSMVLRELPAWKAVGSRLASQLGVDSLNLKPSERSRIYHYYLPVFMWVGGQLRNHQRSQKDATPKPLVVGISAPQGCGKSTLVEQLQELFTWMGHTTASVSVDDFYLTYERQTELAAANPDNTLLQYRGNAGTHDLELGTTTLEALGKLVEPGSVVPVPRYNKSAYAGRGDRATPATWPTVQGPVELVLFEGWMLGFQPLEGGAQAAAAVHPGLAEVDRQLQQYKSAWDSHVDSWLVVRVGEPKWVFDWRLQAEQRMVASGQAGMSEAELQDFVARFIPAYEAYLPGLYSKGPTTARPGHTLVVEVDRNRCPVRPQPAPIM